jgi:hypothetical protein
MLTSPCAVAGAEVVQEVAHAPLVVAERSPER